MSRADESPKCPKCGGPECRRVELAKPARLAIGFAGLATAFLLALGACLLARPVVPAGWQALLFVPVYLASYFGVGFLVEYLVGMRWHCRACDAGFRHQARAA